VSAVATAGRAVTSVLATRVATAAVLIAAVLGALFMLPPVGFGVVVLGVIAAGAFEWAKLIGFAGSRLVAFVALTCGVGAALLAGAAPQPGGGWPPRIVLAVCGVATLFWLGMGTPSVLLNRQPQSALLRALAGILVLLGAFVAVVELQARSPWLVLAAMAIVWIADTAAYFAGRRFGRHKLAPRISPGKTWEGAAGAVIAVIVYALLLTPLAARAGLQAPVGALAIAAWIAFVIVLVALSIVGDLHESLLKRRAGVKDSGTLLPGHGGVLDRTDALLAAMPPVALAALAFLGRP
jgi:phosphatidate cytidylyltransferase